MRLASEGGVGFLEAQVFRARRLRKRLRQLVRYRPGTEKTVLLIVGCQRSGTSMIHHLFRLDDDTVTYDEVSPLSTRDPERLRLDPRELVAARIDADRAPFVVAKPLVESQNVRELLDWFPRTRGIWMHRDVRDVALSNLRYFGQDNGHRDMAAVLSGDASDWRAQHMDPGDVERLRAVYRRDLAPLDAAALFWWARNSLWFSLGCDADERLALCRYEDLVGDPGAVMRAAYGFVERDYPGDGIVRDVFAGSRGRGRDVTLSDPVRRMCDEMHERLASPSAGRRIGAGGRSA